MALSETQIRKASAGPKDYKLADTLGLYLYVTTTGAKSWRMKFRVGGREKRLTFGLYPDVGLKEARDRRDEARRQLREGMDPALERKRARMNGHANAAQTFERFAREWHAVQTDRWSAAYAKLVMRQLERDVFPIMGAHPVGQVDKALVLEACRKIERRGSIETARRIRQHIDGALAFASDAGAPVNESAAKVQRALKRVPKAKKRPALVKLEQLHELIRTLEASPAPRAVTKLASRFLAATTVRPGVLRATPWSEIEGVDWDGRRYGPDLPMWRIPAERMKLDVDKKEEEAFEHLVPLSWQAVECLRAVRRLTGRARMIFPHTAYSHRPMSENTINEAYRDAGYAGRHVPHGWRSSFSTIMNERAERQKRAGDRAVIDLMLAHIPKEVSSSEGEYNRAAFMERRRELAQEWSDLVFAGAPSAHDLIDRR